MTHIETKPKYGKRKNRLLKIARNTSAVLEEGQKVLVCKTMPGNVVSQITGRKMGARERVISAGIVKKVNGEIFVATEKPVQVSVIEVREKGQRLYSRNRTKKAPAIYAKIVEE